MIRTLPRNSMRAVPVLELYKTDIERIVKRMWLIGGLLIALGGLGIILIMELDQLNTHTIATQKAFVQQVCDDERHEITNIIASCATAEVQNNMRYVCNKSKVCQVEINK